MDSHHLLKFSRLPGSAPRGLHAPGVVALASSLLLCLLSGAHLRAATAGPQAQEPSEHVAAQQETPPDSQRAEGPPASEPSSWRARLRTLQAKGLHLYETFNYRGLYPRLDWIAEKSGPALGVRYWQPDLFGPIDAAGAAFYSWRRYQLYDFRIGLIPHRGQDLPPDPLQNERIDQVGDVDGEGFSKVKLYASARFRDRADDSFYGSGPSSNRSDLLRYRIKDALGEVTTGYQWSQHLGLTLKGGYLEHSLACGRSAPRLCENMPAAVLPGIENPPHYFRLRAISLLDFRDSVGIPHRGLMWAVTWTRWDNVNSGDRFNFHEIATDLRGYVPLARESHILALRTVLIDNDPGPSNLVPFFLQPTLGGVDTLRGYDSFRFRGDKLMLIQAEYRWEVTDRFGLALFGDTGTVAERGTRLSLDSLKSDWGLGFRLLGSDRVVLGIDEAFSNEGMHTQIRLGASF